MTGSLQASYAHCQTLTRQAARNFFYSFLVLPRGKRRAMCALYAFLRETDDIGDSDKPLEVRRAELGAWRESLAAAVAGHAQPPILPALVDTVSRYQIPPQYLYDCIDGVEMDLSDRSYETFADLEAYCYKVASAVGLACIHIWGFRDSSAIEPACQLGVAFQLTNILRDLKEDAQRGRVYLPQEDLRRFNYSREDLFAGRARRAFRRAHELRDCPGRRLLPPQRDTRTLPVARQPRRLPRHDRHLSRATHRDQAPRRRRVHHAHQPEHLAQSIDRRHLTPPPPRPPQEQLILATPPRILSHESSFLSFAFV